MGSAPPDGDPAPADGALPAAALASAGERGLGLYVHVPFCAKRCGYCDFNTYTAAELGPPGGPPGASRETYADAAVAEIRFARQVLAGTDRPVETATFVGYLSTVVCIPPIGWLLARLEPTRWGSVILLVTALTVPVLVARLQQLWDVAGG